MADGEKIGEKPKSRAVSPINGQPVPEGRPKGVPNKSTIQFREACTNFINYAAPDMVKWLEEIAKNDKGKALDHVYKFAQFCHPLLARTEQQALDRHGKPTDPVGTETDLAILKRYGIDLKKMEKDEK